MDNRIILPGGFGDYSFKKVIQETIICPQYFDEIRKFSWDEVETRITKGGTIIEVHRRIIVVCRCGHEAVLGNMDNCHLGTIVCRACIRICSEPGCGLPICTADSCRCGRAIEGKPYCSYHGGGWGLLSRLLR